MTAGLVEGRRRRIAAAGLAGLLLALGACALALAPRLASAAFGLIHANPTPDPQWDAARIRLYLSLLTLAPAVVCAGLALTPAQRLWLERLPGRAGFRIAAAGLSAAAAWFVVHFGRMQYGAYDFDIATDLGWRTSLGQVPMRDFVTSMPPGFILGLKCAFRLLGPQWNADVYAAAALAFGSFWWLLWLLRRLAVPRGLALLLVMAVEGAAMLSTCFWWYNNTATMAAAIFFLSCYDCARPGRRLADEASLALSFTLLLMMKPNVAGLAVLLGLLPLTLLGARRGRILGAAAAGAALASAILLAFGMPPWALARAYRAIAADRGGLSLFGLNELHLTEQAAMALWFLLLLVPLLLLLPRLVSMARQGDRGAILRAALLWGTPLVAAYSLMTNGDWHDVEFPALLLASGLALAEGPLWRRRTGALFAVALLVGNLGGDLVYGVQRQRVYSVGLGQFFEWGRLEHVPDGFFRDMSVGPGLVGITREIRSIAATAPGPIFFGPRLMAQYAALREPSPTHLALFWEPGTAFPKTWTPEMLEAWRGHRFPTLVFLRGDFTYYTPEFLRLLATEYTSDDRSPGLTVFSLRPSGR